MSQVLRLFSLSTMILSYCSHEKTKRLVQSSAWVLRSQAESTRSGSGHSLARMKYGGKCSFSACLLLSYCSSSAVLAAASSAAGRARAVSLRATSADAVDVPAAANAAERSTSTIATKCM